MKYFLDTEFIEGPQEKRFLGFKVGVTKPTIDLISIGIVVEDGREYYAISKDFNLKEAWNRFQIEQQSGDMRNIFPEGKKVYWLRENVLKPIYYELIGKDIGFHNYDRFFTYESLKNLIDKNGKTNKEIAEQVQKFCGPDFINERNYTNPEFYAYYANYDWVVFCWLFGKMIDLPKGFPKYCKDLKQILDEKQNQIDFNTSVTEPRQDIKSHKEYPKQDSSKSHNAIEDARWDKELYEFLTTI